MSFATIPAPVYALVGTIIGTIGLKLLDKLLSRKAEKRSERQELRQIITNLQERLDHVEREVTFWRSRFYEEQEDNAVLRVILINNNLEPPSKRIMPPEPD